RDALAMHRVHHLRGVDVPQVFDEDSHPRTCAPGSTVEALEVLCPGHSSPTDGRTRSALGSNPCAPSSSPWSNEGFPSGATIPQPPIGATGAARSRARGIQSAADPEREGALPRNVPRACRPFLARAPEPAKFAPCRSPLVVSAAAYAVALPVDPAALNFFPWGPSRPRWTRSTRMIPVVLHSFEIPRASFRRGPLRRSSCALSPAPSEAVAKRRSPSATSSQRSPPRTLPRA